MNKVNYFENSFESLPDSRKIVLSMFFIKNDVNFLYECEFSKGDIHYLYKKLENVLLERNQEYLV